MDEADPRVRLRRTFLEEGAEQSERLEAALLRLENDPGRIGELDDALRTLHNLKGSAAAVGWGRLAGFVHRVEEAAVSLKGRSERTPGDLEILMEAADALAVHLDEGRTRGPAAEEPEGEGARRMERWSAGNSGRTPPGTVVTSARDTGAGIVGIRFRDGIPVPDLRALLVLRNLGEVGRVVASEPPVERLGDLASRRPCWLWVAVVVAPGRGPADLERACRSPEVEEVDLARSGSPGPASTPQVVPASPGAAWAAGPPPPVAPETSRLRVALETIDELLRTLGEVRATHQDLGRILAGPARPLLTRALGHDLDEVLDRQSRCLARMTEGVLSMRMVPVSRLFARFPRMVRDLAQRLGKQADLRLEGGETELDASLTERLADPLAHLLRNALDHGIEPPPSRTAAGKPAEGRLSVRARAVGQSFRIEVEDDGAGLDLDRIAARARDRGLVPACDLERMGSDELARLVFLPGFTTRDVATEVSGRGVGLDAVKQAVENLNGEVWFEDPEASGTRVCLRFPLTLALSDVLLVRAGGRRWGLPLSHVEEVARRRDVEVRAIAGRGPMVGFRDRPVPYLAFPDLVGMAGSGPRDEARFVVVLASAGKEVAVGVEELLGELEVVVRPLAPHFPEIPGVAGATLEPDGTVVLLLDAPGALRRRSPGGLP